MYSDPGFGETESETADLCEILEENSDLKMDEPMIDFTMCQYPDVTSFNVLYFDLANSGSMSSMVLEYHWFISIALFKSLGSRHSLRLLFGFITGIMELIHSVCSLTSVIIPSLVSLSNSALYAFCMATGTDLGMGLQVVFLFL